MLIDLIRFRGSCTNDCILFVLTLKTLKESKTKTFAKMIFKFDKSYLSDVLENLLTDNWQS